MRCRVTSRAGKLSTSPIRRRHARSRCCVPVGRMFSAIEAFFATSSKRRWPLFR